jgi:hypothetical protein
MPTWLMAGLFALAFVVAGAGTYWLVGYLRAANRADASAEALENVPAKSAAAPNPLQRFVEITGVRFVTAGKDGISARFVLVNHSEAALTGLGGTVNLWGRTQKSEEDAEGSFTFSTDIPALASKELTVPLNTKLKIYELADWQNLSTDVRITAPQ